MTAPAEFRWSCHRDTTALRAVTVRSLHAMGDSDAELLDAIRARLRSQLTKQGGGPSTSEIAVVEDPDILLPNHGEPRIEDSVCIFVFRISLVLYTFTLISLFFKTLFFVIVFYIEYVKFS